MQLEFNKNLTQTLNEKKKEFRMMKENHYDEIGVLKIKMNDAVSVQIKLESLWVTLWLYKIKKYIASTVPDISHNIL